MRQELSLILPKPSPTDNDYKLRNKILKELATGKPDEQILKNGYNSGHGKNTGVVKIFTQTGDYYLFKKSKLKDSFIYQSVNNIGNVSTRQTIFSNNNGLSTVNAYESLNKDGSYFIIRRVNGREYNECKYNINEFRGINPVKSERKLLSGFKGLLEKFAMCVAQNRNGCERPILRVISGKILNTLRHL